MTNPQMPFVSLEDGPGTDIINCLREMLALDNIETTLEQIQENIVWLINLHNGTYFLEHYSSDTQNWLSFVVKDLTPGDCFDFFSNVPNEIKVEIDQDQLLIDTMYLINHDIVWKFAGVYWGPLEEYEDVIWYLKD